MSLKDLIVHVDSHAECAQRLAVAVDLAREHDAHLVGLYAEKSLLMPMVVDAPYSTTLLEEIEADEQRRQAEAEERFRAVCDGAGVNGEWRAVARDPLDAVPIHSRYADLLVVGQEGSEDNVAIGLPDAAVLQSGRPVLVVPYIGAPASMGRRVLVAWNGTREAVRAINDTIALLGRADSVKVLSIDAGSGDADDHIPGADVCLHLARHGVRAQASHTVSDDIEIGDILLSYAADEQSDLLVMGGYGHSRFRELVLGGATRHLLEHMTVPVVMSH